MREMEKDRVMVNKAELQRDKPCTQPQAVVFEGRKEAGILGA